MNFKKAALQIVSYLKHRSSSKIDVTNGYMNICDIYLCRIQHYL